MPAALGYLPWWLSAVCRRFHHVANGLLYRDLRILFKTGSELRVPWETDDLYRSLSVNPTLRGSCRSLDVSLETHDEDFEHFEPIMLKKPWIMFTWLTRVRRLDLTFVRWLRGGAAGAVLRQATSHRKGLEELSITVITYYTWFGYATIWQVCRSLRACYSMVPKICHECHHFRSGPHLLPPLLSSATGAYPITPRHSCSF
jgi:hypothetical protein